MLALTRVALLAMAACSAAPSAAQPGRRSLTFQELTSWPYTNGLDGIPPEVLALDATSVTLTGIAFPIGFQDQFMLVDANAPWLHAPCQDGFTMNCFVRVIPPAGVRVREGQPVSCTGAFSVSPTHIEGDLADIFQLHADQCEPVQKAAQGTGQ